MAYALTQLAADIRETLKSSTGRAAKDIVCGHVSKALRDPLFLTTHLKDRAPGAHPREVLYEDPEVGFCICGHPTTTDRAGPYMAKRPALPR
jgi:hypothetical protein